MSPKRILVTFLTLVFALGLSSFAFAQEAKKDAAKDDKVPQLTIVEPLKDYGTVPKGEKINWEFVVKNTGKSDLQILSAQPSCGCTVANFDKVIKPGETGKVGAHVDTTAFAGPISKTITLQTNDPNTPSAQLTIHAVVKPFVEAYPAGFVRYNLLQGDTATQSVVIYSEEDEPFQVTGIDVPGDYVKANFTKIENEADRVKAGKPGQTQYKVDITFGGPTVQLGPIAERIKIKTNSKHQPEYPVSLTGVIRPTYSVQPTILNFGEVAPTDASAVRNIMLRSNSANAADFKVEKVESSLSTVLSEVQPSADKPGEYTVKVRLQNDATAGQLDGNLKIYTSDKTNPVFTVPVKALVKQAEKPASK